MRRLLATIIVAAISISGRTALADTAVGLEMTTSRVDIVDGGRNVEGDISCNCSPYLGEFMGG